MTTIDDLGNHHDGAGKFAEKGQSAADPSAFPGDGLARLVRDVEIAQKAAWAAKRAEISASERLLFAGLNQEFPDAVAIEFAEPDLGEEGWAPWVASVYDADGNELDDDVRDVAQELVSDHGEVARRAWSAPVGGSRTISRERVVPNDMEAVAESISRVLESDYAMAEVAQARIARRELAKVGALVRQNYPNAAKVYVDIESVTDGGETFTVVESVSLADGDDNEIELEDQIDDFEVVSQNLSTSTLAREADSRTGSITIDIDEALRNR